MSPKEISQTIQNRKDFDLSERQASMLSILDQGVQSHRNGEYAKHLGIESPDLNNQSTYQVASFGSSITEVKCDFLLDGLPKYPWESEPQDSDARESLKYFDDYARNNRGSLSSSDKQVVYVVNYPQSNENDQYLCSKKPPYGEDGKFVDGVETCTAIVANKDSLNSTGIEGMYTVHTNTYTHMHFPMPEDAQAPDFADAIKQQNDNTQDKNLESVVVAALLHKSRE